MRSIVFWNAAVTRDRDALEPSIVPKSDWKRPSFRERKANRSRRADVGSWRLGRADDDEDGAGKDTNPERYGAGGSSAHHPDDLASRAAPCLCEESENSESRRDSNDAVSDKGLGDARSIDETKRGPLPSSSSILYGLYSKFCSSPTHARIVRTPRHQGSTPCKIQRNSQRNLRQALQWAHRAHGEARLSASFGFVSWILDLRVSTGAAQIALLRPATSAAPRYVSQKGRVRFCTIRPADRVSEMPLARGERAWPVHQCLQKSTEFSTEFSRTLRDGALLSVDVARPRPLRIPLSFAKNG